MGALMSRGAIHSTTPIHRVLYISLTMIPATVNGVDKGICVRGVTRQDDAEARTLGQPKKERPTLFVVQGQGLERLARPQRLSRTGKYAGSISCIRSRKALSSPNVTWQNGTVVLCLSSLSGLCYPNLFPSIWPTSHSTYPRPPRTPSNSNRHSAVPSQSMGQRARVRDQDRRGSWWENCPLHHKDACPPRCPQACYVVCSFHPPHSHLGSLFR